MTPVSFDECFGWLHVPANNAGSTKAVVICQGLMRDALLAYSSFRVLGDDLAAAGYWVLRYDYPGTGDSLDAEVERAGGHWNAWQRSVDRACDWLRSASGADEVILCGLAAGAMLAVDCAARRNDVAGLLVFEPVVSGRTYVRQIILEADMQNGQSSVRGEDLVIREFHFSAATLDQIAAIDLRKTALKAGTKVGLFTRPETRQIDECAEAWRSGGADVSLHGWDGLVPLMRHAVIDENALADYRHVMAWLTGALPTQATPPRPLPGAARLEPPGLVETPLHFGDKLFGILAQPAGGKTDRIVLMGNSGRDPHYGAARMNVDFSRYLARAGIACLRLDFAGLGDSKGPPGKENLLTHAYSNRVQDISSAIDALEPLGYRRFAMLGLCAGAYQTFHCALADPRLTDLLMLDLAMFTLPQGDVLDYLENRGQTPMYLVRKLLNPGSWKTFLSGKSDVPTLVRSVFKHVGRQVSSKSLAVARKLGFLKEESFPVRSVGILSRRGARILFVYSPGDRERDAFAREFGRNGEGLARFANARLVTLERMDHDLTRAVARRDVEKTVLAFLSEAA